MAKTYYKNLLFGQIFPKNCMKMKKNWTQRGARVPGAPLDPPMETKGCYFVVHTLGILFSRTQYPHIYHKIHYHCFDTLRRNIWLPDGGSTLPSVVVGSISFFIFM